MLYKKYSPSDDTVYQYNQVQFKCLLPMHDYMYLLYCA